MDALKRVLQNLIKNVYTHGKEFLHIQLNDNSIEIANRADRLKELDVERIFERFYTVDASRTGKSTGLGLAISKELVTRMGWQITINIEEDILVVRILWNKK
ncbi:MAG: sensor histidine kinase [Clostridiales bacterium]|jgi:signal transduction histidine kinase|nr:sensor histidine kinase [Clostridiales bacterium]